MKTLLILRLAAFALTVCLSSCVSTSPGDGDSVHGPVGGDPSTWGPCLTCGQKPCECPQ